MLKRLQQIKEENDGKIPHFSWPGGYPLYYITRDGGILSPESVEKNEKLCSGDDPQWEVIGVEANWEDEDMYCDDSGKKIPSAYGD